MKKQNGITLIALIITIIVMLILVGVTVNVALNGGLFDAAKLAASGMNMAQIKEKAETTKVVLIADAETKDDVTANVSTLKNRLLEEFGVTDDTDGNNAIEVNDKYAIIIKNADLELEVVETENIPVNITALECTASDVKIENDIIGKNIDIKILQTTTTFEEYIQDKEQELQKISAETKLQAFLHYFNEEYGWTLEEPLTTVDEVVVYGANENFGTTYTTIEECLADETIQSNWGTTKEQLYYGFNDYYVFSIFDTTEITEQELLNAFYMERVYVDEYYRGTSALRLYVSINGGKEQIINPSKNADLATEQTFTYKIGENGRHKIILRTYDGEEVASEIIEINDIVDSIYVIEADETWTTNGMGTITGYAGEDTEVIVPLIIGGENITKIGANVFKDNTNITSVTILEGVTSIGAYAFANCWGLAEITIPNSVTSMERDIFLYCRKLETIYFAAGSNPIPNEDLKPWGATKGDAVQVIKLEQPQS